MFYQWAVFCKKFFWSTVWAIVIGVVVNFGIVGESPFMAWRFSDRGAMSLIICRGHIRLPKGTFGKFLWLKVIS